MDDEKLIDEIIEREGGATYTNDPGDRGGPTKYGITLATLAKWRDAPVEAMDVQALTLTEARQILRDRYLVQPGFAKLAAPELRAAVVDAAVNQGVDGATRMLQRALGVKDDGIIGPKTLAAANGRNGRTVALHLAAERAMRYGRLITDDAKKFPDFQRMQAKFAAGWMNRLAAQIKALA